MKYTVLMSASRALMLIVNQDMIMRFDPRVGRWHSVWLDNDYKKGCREELKTESFAEAVVFIIEQISSGRDIEAGTVSEWLGHI